MENLPVHKISIRLPFVIVLTMHVLVLVRNWSETDRCRAYAQNTAEQKANAQSQTLKPNDGLQFKGPDSRPACESSPLNLSDFESQRQGQKRLASFTSNSVVVAVAVANGLISGRRGVVVIGSGGDRSVPTDRQPR